jgi:hypothetical protein
LIFVSGLLVLVAAGLLIAGIVSSISVVYAAFGLSILAVVVLIVGVFRHPAEVAPAGPPIGVLVVSGRPRYHLAGCEYLSRDELAEPLEVTEARVLGFTPCDVCRPDRALASGQS